MNPAKVIRAQVRSLTDLPNVGPSIAGDLRLLGVREPALLEGCCPFELYERLCTVTARRHDPCVIDVFMSVTEFVAGGPALPWWHFTPERKRRLGASG